MCGPHLQATPRFPLFFRNVFFFFIWLFSDLSAAASAAAQRASLVEAFERSYSRAHASTHAKVQATLVPTDESTIRKEKMAHLQRLLLERARQRRKEEKKKAGRPKITTSQLALHFPGIVGIAISAHALEQTINAKGGQEATRPGNASLAEKVKGEYLYHLSEQKEQTKPFVPPPPPPPPPLPSSSPLEEKLSPPNLEERSARDIVECELWYEALRYLFNFNFNFNEELDPTLKYPYCRQLKVLLYAYMSKHSERQRLLRSIMKHGFLRVIDGLKHRIQAIMETKDERYKPLHRKDTSKSNPSLPGDFWSFVDDIVSQNNAKNAGGGGNVASSPGDDENAPEKQREKEKEKSDMLDALINELQLEAKENEKEIQITGKATTMAKNESKTKEEDVEETKVGGIDIEIEMEKETKEEEEVEKENEKEKEKEKEKERLEATEEVKTNSETEEGSGYVDSVVDAILTKRGEVLPEKAKEKEKDKEELLIVD